VSARAQATSLTDRGTLPYLVVFGTAVASLLVSFVISDFQPFRQSVLGQGPRAAITISPHDLVIGGTHLVPGAWTMQRVQIGNPGKVPFAYSLRIETERVGGVDLAPALYAILRTEGRGCDRFDGRVLGRGPVATFVTGDPKPGLQAGDRLLPGGRTEPLCLRVMLPVNAGNEFQAASTRLRLVVTADTAGSR
jgi:hypothetical protein